MRMATRLVMLLVVLSGQLHAQDVSHLKALYDAHRWFLLRSEVNAGSPLFYRAAVAAAFNQVGVARTELEAAIAHPSSTALELEARELLVGMLFRAGDYRNAFLHAKGLLAREPNAADIQNILPTLELLSADGAQTIEARWPCTVPAEFQDENLVLPVKINGADGHYIFDNGFSLSGISESEAKRLKLRVRESGTRIDSMAGEQVKIRVAVARSLSIGRAHLHNVAFYVLPDSQPPFNGLESGRRGILGMQVILALRHFEWSSSHRTFSVLPDSENSTQPNLAFDGTSTVTRVYFRDEPLNFSLDLGADKTDLYPSFGRQFPDVQASGSPEKHKLTGVGGSADFESVLVPSLSFRAGGYRAVLAPAHLLLRENNASASQFAGNLGMDLLNECENVEINFASMTMMLK